jgi:glyoxylase-like metal-dependent hydrolase (beta-lactamase superfamily II)
MIRIEPVHLADIRCPEGHPRAGETIPVYAFLIQHPDGLVLVDSGVGPPHAAVDDTYQIARRTLAQLFESMPVRVEQVGWVVNTHLHFDHAGENRLFAGRPIVVQPAEYEAAGMAGYTVTDRVLFPGADYRLVPGDSEILPGIQVLSTPGHTAGHQSVLVETEDGTVLVAGQAIETADEFGRGRPADRNVSAAANPARYVASFRRLQDLAPRRVYFSHDGAIWERRGAPR